MKTNIKSRQNNPIIILLGLPGSGKSTQARLLSRTYGLTCVSPGNILRRLVAEGDARIREQIESFMFKGAFMPDELFSSLVLDPLKTIYDTSTGLILDGVPRSLTQANALEALIKEPILSKAIYLRISSSLMRERVTQRLVCKDCQAPGGHPGSPLKCDFCQGSMLRRQDDSSEVMDNRWKEYLKKTEPLIRLYESEGKLTHIDAAQPIHIVFSDIITALGSALNPSKERNIK